ncbi:Motile sperm domain-containing protein 2-like protein, partial [Leptotrombidium deliense]
MAGIFSYPADKEGNLMLYVRGKMHRKIEIVYGILKQYLVYHLNKLDLMQAKERSWCIIVDATGSGFENAELHMALFILDTLHNYFPMGIKRFVIYGMPMFLNTFANFALSMTPGFAKQLIKFWGQKELQEHVDENSLPDFLGGNCKECYRKVPKGALDIYY